jgi:hypothetical protein
MKLVVPYVNELQSVDARMIALATFLGVRCETLQLSRDVARGAGFSQLNPGNESASLLLHASVMKEWLREDCLPVELVSFIVSQFRCIIVHGLQPDSFDSRVVAALSRDGLQSLRGIHGASSVYEIARDSGQFCGPFAGLSFGPANPGNDQVLSIGAGGSGARALISIDGLPYMAVVKNEKAEVLFVAGKDIVDLSTEVGDAPLSNYFSRFLPQAMALRYVADAECWTPGPAYASIIIDDPLLHKRYGFLNFDSLLRLAQEHNFHASIAFIPHNFRRNSRRIIRLFLENAERLSLCFHGNDHTESEFASREPTILSALLQNAEHRMNVHEQVTGLRCDKVMVFPQGNFSIEAMKVLRSRNFNAAVNTVPYPMGEEDRLTIRDLAQPAVLRYGGFPLFLRKPSRKVKQQDIAFNVFFGRPVLIVEHHEIFQNPESLLEVVANINSLVPDVRWANLTTIVSRSFLTRREGDGTLHVRPYAELVRVSNDSSYSKDYLIDWQDSFEGASVEWILENETKCMEHEIDQRGLRVASEIAPYSSRTFSLVHSDVFVPSKSLGYRRHAQAFVRRRLSEIRDNHLSKNQRLLRFAKNVQQRMLH